MLQFNPDSVLKKIDMDFTKKRSQSLAAFDMNLEEETVLSSTVECDGGEVNELDRLIGTINDRQKLDEILYTNPRLGILSQDIQSKPPGQLTVSYNIHCPTGGIISHAEQVLDPDPALVDSILRSSLSVKELSVLQWNLKEFILHVCQVIDVLTMFWYALGTN